MDGLLVGFRFYPTEEELVSFYLPHKLMSTRPDIDRVIPVVDICDYNPWDLPQFAGELCPRDTEQWFFFTPRQEREARGGRPNRLTRQGYWKATGSPGEVYSSSADNNNGPRIIGKKKTMVFYKGRAPNGTKTQWKMNEYKVFETTDDEAFASTGQTSAETLEHLFITCRISSLVWKLSHVQWDSAYCDQSYFKKWWSQHRGMKKMKCIEAMMQLSTYISWCLWISRNLWIFEKVLIPEKKLVDIALGD